MPLLAGLSPPACKRHTHVSLVHFIDAWRALQSSHDWQSRCRTGIKALSCQTRQDSKAKMAANRAQHKTRKTKRGCSMCLSPLANQVGKMSDTEGATPPGSGRCWATTAGARCVSNIDSCVYNSTAVSVQVTPDTKSRFITYTSQYSPKQCQSSILSHVTVLMHVPTTAKR